MTGILGSTDPDAQGSIPRNVSFIQSVDSSSAHEAHCPPTLLRQQAQQAARAPSPDAVDFEQLSLGANPGGNPSGNPTKSKKVLEKKEKVHVLLAVTGSVATVKIPLIVHRLRYLYHERVVIQLIVTNAAKTFVDIAKDLPKDVKVWCDEDEWKSRSGNADASLHIQLRRWADILLVAPCSANTLAKFAYGICDNLLTSVFRVWNPAVPILLAPAMNTQMYLNPVTKRHDKIIKQSYPYVEVLRPVEKVLVCGDIGMGGMREWTDIVLTLSDRIGLEMGESGSDTDSD